MSAPISVAGVMGSPIGHSLSPVLHRAAYDALGLTGWTYEAREVTEPELADTLADLGPQWAGVSLTMPLKHVALELSDEVTPLALAVGAVNTLTLRDGRRLGDNTDVAGIVEALRAGGVGDLAGDASAVVLGGGATAASAVAALRELGVREPHVVVRSVERSARLLAAAERLGVGLRLRPWDEAATALGSAAVVISTLPQGAADQLASGPTGGGLLLDVVYRPWPTALARAWAAGGGRAVPGLDMLVHQAVAQIVLWTGLVPDAAVMAQAGRAALAAR